MKNKSDKENPHLHTLTEKLFHFNIETSTHSSYQAGFLFSFASMKLLLRCFLLLFSPTGAKVILRLRNGHDFLLNPPPSEREMGQQSNQTSFGSHSCSSVSSSPAQGPGERRRSQTEATKASPLLIRKHVLKSVVG